MNSQSIDHFTGQKKHLRAESKYMHKQIYRVIGCTREKWPASRCPAAPWTHRAVAFCFTVGPLEQQMCFAFARVGIGADGTLMGTESIHEPAVLIWADEKRQMEGMNIMKVKFVDSIPNYWSRRKRNAKCLIFYFKVTVTIRWYDIETMYYSNKNKFQASSADCLTWFPYVQ